MCIEWKYGMVMIEVLVEGVYGVESSVGGTYVFE